ncbi:NAD-dependent epimerase/dehydratase family protein [Acrocarpospora catenulata]|uniref:NAD-dependent epimerase/dehydratase family protein n=1 Tax=Acrocarpospora catenulata TaxID=2836182 RepID=UPI001BDAB18A|nr:NAD-dependent epimerase/dehydratase family protein [Acrocarpospora catenulata]
MAGRIVVTGSAGMLGATLVQRLVQTGQDVLGVDLRPREGQGAAGDIRDTPRMAELMAGASAVVHTASALPSYPEPEIHDVIVNGTRSVLDAARQAGVPRVVHISSTAVYGLPELVPTPEDHLREPYDAYGRAKTAAEEIAEKFRADGLCVPIIRPKTFLGPGRMGLFAMLFEWAEQGHGFPLLGKGGARIQMLAIEDLVAAIECVLAAPESVAGDTYNIAAAEFGTLREDFQAVLDAAGHGKRLRSLPARPALGVLRLLGRTGLSPVYDRLLYKLLADSYVSIDKARERLGFQPQLSNRDAILAAYAWWREHAGPPAPGGRTSRDAWKQGALSFAKVFF